MFSSPLISMRTVAAVSLPETTVAWSSKRTSWVSPNPVTNVIASQETDGNLPPHGGISPLVASRKIDDKSPHRRKFEVRTPLLC
jgi:hypothetical protein